VRAGQVSFIGWFEEMLIFCDTSNRGPDAFIDRHPAPGTSKWIMCLRVKYKQFLRTCEGMRLQEGAAVGTMEGELESDDLKVARRASRGFADGRQL
jgi:hypothetical protein